MRHCLDNWRRDELACRDTDAGLNPGFRKYVQDHFSKLNLQERRTRRRCRRPYPESPIPNAPVLQLLSQLQ